MPRSCSPSVACSGALISGWVADYMTYRGMRAGRIVIAAGARLLGFPLFLLTFTIGNTPMMLVAFAFAAMCLIAPQAPLNAARADVLHPSLRGRGTSLDIVLQSSASAVAPVIVGVLADVYNLRTAFLIMMPLMAAVGVDPADRDRHLRPRGDGVRRQIRAEALGDDAVESRRSTRARRRRRRDRRPGGDPAGTHRPDGQRGRRPAGDRGPRRLVRVDPGAVRCRHASARRGRARPRRPQRRGQDDAVEHDRRAGRGAPRAHPLRRPRPHRRAARTARQARDHADGRRAVDVPDDVGRGEHLDRRLPVPRSPSGGPGAPRCRARGVPGAARPAAPERRHALGWRAADGRPGEGVDGGARGCCWSTSCRSVWRRW